MVVLDSLPGSFIKPTAHKVIEKIIKLLKEVDGNLEIEEWSLNANKPGDIPSQTNDYDCGIFTCMYARSLVNAIPMIVPTIRSISDVRSYMNLELHRNVMLPIPPHIMKVEEYYAVDMSTSTTLAGFFAFRVNLSDSSFCMVFGMVQMQRIALTGQEGMMLLMFI